MEEEAKEKKVDLFDAPKETKEYAQKLLLTALDIIKKKPQLDFPTEFLNMMIIIIEGQPNEEEKIKRLCDAYIALCLSYPTQDTAERFARFIMLSFFVYDSYKINFALFEKLEKHLSEIIE